MRKRDPLTIEEALPVLMRAARNVGRAYSVTMSVGKYNDELLVFVNDLGEPIVDDFAQPADGREWEEGLTGVIAAANAEEIRTGEFLKLFAARVLYAALVQKLLDMVASEQEAQE